jgi:hypothetical protein
MKLSQVFPRRANYRDKLVLTMGPLGHLLSASYMPNISPLAPTNCAEYASHLPECITHFASTVSWEMAVPGMTLRTVLADQNKPLAGLKHIPGAIHRAQAAGGSGQGVFAGQAGEMGADPEPAGMFGFLQRYWYILLPILITNAMNGGDAPKEGEEGAGGEGQPQQAAGQVAGAGAATASPPKGKQRRGKRD